MTILKQDLSTVVGEAMGRYAEAVITDRAIPDSRDGLKPVQRRLLAIANKENLGSDKKHMKLAKLSGLVLALHPHGSVSISESAVTLSQDWVRRAPLIDIHGNNGSIDGDSAAADRYIEARMTPASELLLNGIQKNAVDMVDNYDNTMEEPTVLPAAFPNLFTNGSTGIAVGYATNIPTHNPVELLKASVKLLNNPDTKLSDLMKIVKGPDFPTGGTIMGYDGIKEMYKTGKGKFAVRGKAEIVNEGKNQQIIITEIPYDITKVKVIESMADVIEGNKINSVQEIRDDSEGENVRIVIEMKKDTDAQTLLNLLFSKSSLQINYSANIMAISHKKPRLMPLKDYLNDFLEFKQETQTKIFNFDLDRAKRRLHLVEGFLRLLDISDEVIAEIKLSSGKEDSANRIANKFDFSDEQAMAIVSMQLYRLSNQDAISLKDEQGKLNEKIDQLQKWLSDDVAFKQEITRQLEETQEVFSSYKRLTEIQKEVEEVTIDTSSLIKAEKVVVVAKREGVIQRMSQRVFENNFDTYEDKERLVFTGSALTTDGALFFTRDGLSFYRSVDEIDTQSIKLDTQNVQKDISTFKSDDSLIGGATFKLDDADQIYILSITEQGMAKISTVSELMPNIINHGYFKRTKTFNGLKNSGDKVKFAFAISKEQLENETVSIKREKGQKINFLLNSISLQGANGGGASKVKVKDGDAIVDVEIGEKSSQQELL